MLQTWNCLAHRVGGADQDDDRPGHRLLPAHPGEGVQGFPSEEGLEVNL